MVMGNSVKIMDCIELSNKNQGFVSCNSHYYCVIHKTSLISGLLFNQERFRLPDQIKRVTDQIPHNTFTLLKMFALIVLLLFVAQANSLQCNQCYDILIEGVTEDQKKDFTESMKGPIHANLSLIFITAQYLSEDLRLNLISKKGSPVH